MDTGGITPDTIKALQSGYKSPNLLGMIGDIGRGGLSNLESLVRGGVAQFGGTPVDTLNTIRTPYPMEVMGDVNYAPDKQVYGGTKDILGMMPKRVTQARPETAGMEELGTMIAPGLAKAAMPAVRAGQKGLNLLGMEVADRVATGQSVLPSLLKEPQSAMFAVNPADQMAQAATKAEVSPLGFYSAVEQQALKIPRKQGTGDSFLNDLMKGQDVKKYEIEAMGLENYLRGKPNVTRQEVQDFIANNKIDVQERQLSGRGDKSGVFSEFNPDKNQFIVYGNDLSLHGAFNTAEEADNFVKQYNSQIPYGPSRYDKYQLPGGENYREVLLTLPSKGKPELDIAQQQANNLSRQTADLMSEWKNLSEQMPGDPRVVALYQRVAESRKLRDQAESQVNNLKKQISEETYKSSHFNEPNILAHMRVNDRVDAEGKKMLLIEEVQSDWHQAGREKGYQNKSGQYGEKVSPEEYKRGVALQNQQRNQSEPLTASEQAELNDIMGRHEASIVGGRVPDAPFKDTWHQLALKRAIKEAVDKGYDRIGLTTGAQQAERYNLSNHVQDLTLHGTGDNLRLSATAADGTHKVIDMQHVTPKTLPNYIGKEAAQKLLSQPEPDLNNPYAARNLFGADLQVGGEGMKKYYDEIYPNYLDKLGKKYGARVGETKVNTVKERAENSMIPTMKQEPVRYLDITPEMRKAVKEGQPLASIEEELAKALA
jgi:hypothetical protein